MRAYSNPQPGLPSGYTDVFRVAYSSNSSLNDFTAAATTQSITLTTLSPGDVVEGLVLIEAPTFLSGGSVSAATASIGVTGTATQFTAAANVFTGGTAYTVSGASVPPYVATSSIAMICAITTTTANISTLTAGELIIYAKINRKATRNPQL